MIVPACNIVKFYMIAQSYMIIQAYIPCAYA